MNNTFRMSAQRMEDIQKTFRSLMAGDCKLYDRDVMTDFEESGTKAFLENFSKGAPDLFLEKEFIIEMMMGLLKPDERCIYCTDFLDPIFDRYVDDSLKKDKDVVQTFLFLFSAGAGDEGLPGESYLVIPSLCFEVPHEILMDDDVFELLLKASDPASIYDEILTDEEKVDDDILFRLLKWYPDHGICASAGKDNLVLNLGYLMKSWSETVMDDFRKDEYCDRISENNEPESASEFFCLIDEFLEYAGNPDAVMSHGTESASTITDKYELYEKRMRDLDAEEHEEFRMTPDEPGYGFHRKTDFVRLMDPYYHQMVMFDAALEGNLNAFLPKVHAARESENAGDSQSGGEFMNFPDDACDELPFL
ncbi:MAG: hypothetical protein K5871_09800 [Lachnospiraceae bacterium]|nr:hypothetical protein [Lachnospiraceae bacterium]